MRAREEHGGRSGMKRELGWWLAELSRGKAGG